MNVKIDKISYTEDTRRLWKSYTRKFIYPLYNLRKRIFLNVWISQIVSCEFAIFLKERTKRANQQFFSIFHCENQRISIYLATFRQRILEYFQIKFWKIFFLNFKEVLLKKCPFRTFVLQKVCPLGGLSVYRIYSFYMIGAQLLLNLFRQTRSLGEFECSSTFEQYCSCEK